MRLSLVMTALVSGLAVCSIVVRGAVPEPLQNRPAVQKIHPSLRAPGKQANVLIRLEDPPLIKKVGANAKQLGLKLSRDQQVAYARQLRLKQREVSQLIEARGGRVVGHMTAALNAVLARVSTDHLPALSELVSVEAIRPVVDSELDLSETVPAVGATVLHEAGITGAGIRVAVLDSGIDYTHFNLGGAGTSAAYDLAYGTAPGDPKNTTRDGLFPTAKVIEGWDFVGEVWPNGPGGFDDPIEPDEDPIDLESHGTHVADIIAGKSSDGVHKGVAPDAKLYAFKVCSAVATSCNGFAIFLGMEASLHPDFPGAGLDPEYDGIIENPVDVINMSLGSDYGQMQDDKAYVAQLLSEFGITVVVAAGNGGDRPYIFGSPGVAPATLSVGQTEVPGSKAYTIRMFLNGNRVTSSILNTTALPWAAVTKTVTGPVIYLGRGCASDSYPVPDSQIAGKIALIDRGACNISEKIDRAARAGAVGVFLANNVPGDPPGFSQGNGSVFVPTLVITQLDGRRIVETLSNPANRLRSTFGPTLYTSLAGSMATTSSRGPSYTFQTIKPDISAPGASVSAIAGSGTDQEPFGGTSGATPVVAGAVALLQSASVAESGLPWSPWAVKGLLMNNAEPGIFINPASQPNVKAPITRVGAGEVRVDRALKARAVAIVVDPPIEDGGFDDLQPSLSFGYRAVHPPGLLTLTKEIVVLDFSGRDRTFSVGHTFRYPDDLASGAVTLSFSSPTLTVPAFGDGSVVVTLTVDPAKLSPWTLNGGKEGANGGLLSLLEYDGYVQITDASDALSLPWHVLPRKAADLAVNTTEVVLEEGTGTVELSNAQGAVGAASEVFALAGTSPEDYAKPDPFGGNIALPDLKAMGARVVGTNLELGFATHDEWSHPVTPVGFLAFLDVDGDDLEDYVLYTGDETGNGQATVTVQDLNTGIVLGSVLADADLNSSALIMRVPLAALRLTSSSTLSWYAASWDNYFTGELTDAIFDPASLFLRQKLNQPRYAVDGSPSKIVAPGTSVTLNVTQVPGGDLASPSQEGILLLHRQARPGRWSDVIGVVPGTVPE